MKTLYRNGLTLPINDAHVYQRRGVILAYRNGEPLHFTVLKCVDDLRMRCYFGAARADNLQDFEAIMDYGDNFALVTNWLKQSSL